MTDEELLEAALELDTLSDGARSAFEDMQHRAEPLTKKQRAWLESAVAGQRYEPPEEYENLWSRGLVPRGQEVETPEVLKNLPKRPPGKRA